MNVYSRAIREILDERRESTERGLAAWERALEENPALGSAFRDYQTQAINRARKLPHTFENAKSKLSEVMRLVGLTREMFEPPARCAECGDTGYSGGKMCRCVIKRVIASDKENLALPMTELAAAKSTAPKAIAKLYPSAEEYIAAAENADKPFFVILGSSGTGKTVLASAMATELMSRGYSVVTTTSFEFVRRAKEYHTQFAIEDYRDLFTPMTDCDALVIDDLGTESILRNITREYFYTVINERWLRKKLTIITSNLSLEQLLERYGEAVFSRLCDRSRAAVFAINAKNARI